MLHLKPAQRACRHAGASGHGHDRHFSIPVPGAWVFVGGQDHGGCGAPLPGPATNKGAVRFKPRKFPLMFITSHNYTIAAEPGRGRVRRKARPLQIEPPGGWCHVSACGHERKVI